MRFILSLLSLGSIIWVAIDSNRLISSVRVTKKDLGGLGPVGWLIVVFFISIIGIILYMVFRSRALTKNRSAGSSEPGYVHQPPLGPNGGPLYRKPPKTSTEIVLIVIGSLFLVGVLAVVVIFLATVAAFHGQTF